MKILDKFNFRGLTGRRETADTKVGEFHLSHRKNLARLFDASVAELVELARQGATAPTLRAYARLLHHYLQGDVPGLARWVGDLRRDLGDSSEEKSCRLLAEIRLRIRQQDVDRKLLAEAAEWAKQAGDWAGEIYFCLGTSYSKLADHAQAQQAYERAFPTLEEVGAKRKATKALFNHVVCESRLYPDKKLIADYHYLAKRASKVKDYGTAAICCTNISREYQKLGAMEVALKYCDRALRMLKDDVGAIDYYLALAHRCHLLLEMGRAQEAELDYQTAQAADFPEVREALKVIDRLRSAGRSRLAIQVESLTPTWRERLEAGGEGAAKKLSPLEGRLLQFIAQAPRTKFEIIEHLYPEKAEFKLLEDRFKNLLNRLKKSRPGLVVFEHRKYRISDESFLERHWARGEKKRAS